MLHSHSQGDETGGCVVLNVNKLANENAFQGGDFRGELVADGGPSLATTRIRFETRWSGPDELALRIQFVVAASPPLPRGEHKGGLRRCEQVIQVVVERNADGSATYWMKCPLVQGGSVCSKRSGKLYLPSGADRFGCRHCHGLFYSAG